MEQNKKKQEESVPLSRAMTLYLHDIVHLLCLWSLTIGGTAAYSIYDVYHNVNTGTDISIENLGVLTTLRLETKFLIFGAGDEGGNGVGDLTIMDPDNLGDILGTPTTPSTPEGETVKYYDQTMEIDFDALIAQAEASGDTAMATLHKYFQAQTPTKTNDFTGLFEGKNLIYMVCESFSPEVISEELTPTLYKLANEGIKFNNFYILWFLFRKEGGREGGRQTNCTWGLAVMGAR